MKQQSAALQTLAEDFKELLKAISGDDVSATQRAKFTEDIKAIGKAFEDEFTKLGERDLIGFDDEIKEIQGAFRDLDGTKIRLVPLIEEGLSDIEAQLSKLRFSLPVELKLIDLGIGGGASQPDNTSNELIKISKEFKKLDENLDSYNGTSLTARNNVALLRTSFFELEKTLEANRERLTQVKKEFFEIDLPGGGSDFVVTERAPDAEQVAAFQKIEQSLKTINNLTRQGEFTEALRELGTIGDSETAVSGIPKIEEGLVKLNETIKQVTESRLKLAEADALQQQQNGLLVRYSEILDALADEGFTIDFDIDNDDVRQKIKDTIEAVQQFSNDNAVIIPIQTQQQQIPGPVQLNKRGGPIYRNNGGFVPRGTDTVPAMLSPGEFVVNAAASRRFYSQLQAINSGQQPVYRQQGGPVTNTNVGDINVNVTAQENQIDGRGIAKDIRRELRRNSARL